VLMAVVVVTARMVTLSAHAAVCASNQRQLGLAMMTFSQDNAGKIPPPNIDNSADCDSNGKLDIYENPDYGNWWGYLRTYLPDIEFSKIFICPSGNWLDVEVQQQKDAEPDYFKKGVLWYGNSYGYNRALGEGFADDVFPQGNHNYKAWVLIKIPRPSETPALSDFWSVTTVSGNLAISGMPFFTAWRDPITGTGTDLGANFEVIRISHRNKANHLFFDGSVRAVVPLSLGASGTNAIYWGATNTYRGKY